MHFDTQNHAGANAIVASAQSRGIPVVSSKQMLDWLDGRNGSYYENISWNTDQLGFTVNVGVGALNLRGMVPVISEVGNLIGLTQDASPISYTTETIKGIDYAFFPATDGDYVASYGTDDINPVITDITASPLPDGTVTITWTTDELADSRVDYGLSSGTLDLNNTDETLVTNHSITLTGLAFNTTYYFQVTSTDAFDNSTIEPETPADFTTANGNCAKDITDTDFNLGTPGANTLVVLEDGGGVILKPRLNEEFSGTIIPTGWQSIPWTGGSSIVSGGSVTVDGSKLISVSPIQTFEPGTSLEFVAIFGASGFQHIGFCAGTDAEIYNGDTPWAMFSTNSTTNQLYARTLLGSGGTTNVLIDAIGEYIGTTHLYLILWKESTI